MTRVLIVDDEPGIRRSLAAFLKNDGYEVEMAEDVPAALSVVDKMRIDVIISDIVMPGESGVELLAKVHERNDGIAVVLVTGEPNVETASEAVRHGAFDYLAKPITKSALLSVVARAARAKAMRDENLRLLEENEKYRNNLEELVETRTVELQMALRSTIGVIAQALETRDPYTAGHQRRVAGLALEIAHELALTDLETECVEMAALVHDVGKIAIPAEILAKPGRLSHVEFLLIKTHSQVGYEIFSEVQLPWPVAEIIIQHHERLDGSGYPNGLVGSDIRMEARIIGVADVVEAMASHRPYRPAHGVDAALSEIERLKGKHFDNSVVDTCVQLFRHGYSFDPMP